MTHLHMLMAGITVVLFLYQAGLIFSGKMLTSSRQFTIISHIIYTLLVLSGGYLLWQLWQVAGIQHWAIAKIILLIVAISANIKALRNPTPNQKKAGMMVSGIAYAGIILLAITKPMLQ